MTRTYALIGVPSSAGAHWPGQEKAPWVLRDVGLVERLQEAGCQLVDYGDLPHTRWHLDPDHHFPHSLPAVLNVAQRLAEHVHVALQAGHIPLVIGGDCTIELGALSGLLRRHADIALLYFDGGVDLRTPADNPTGMLDSMGVAHMLAAPGAAEALSHIGPRFPLMTDDRVVLFGYTPNQQGPEHAALARYAMPRYTGEQVHDQPEATASRARTQVEQLAEHFVIHFDVDVIDFMNFPIADVPQINDGLTFQEAMTCLSVFVASPKFMGLTITEFNPDHADENGMFATKFVEGLVNGLAGPPTKR